MIEIVEHGKADFSGAILIIGDGTPFVRREDPNRDNRGRTGNYFHTRNDQRGEVTVKLYGEGDGFDLTDGRGSYMHIDLPTVEMSDDGKDWSESDFGIWLPDRNIWVGISRRISYGNRSSLSYKNLQLRGPHEVDTNLAASIYEAIHGRRFEEEVAKLDPSKKI